jgi:aryl-alcohol dehydrogenase-like predicted oxidoreductase
MGEVLGERRKDIVLATKFGMAMDDAGRKQGGSRRYIMEAVEASLTRLKTDYIDLYQIHRPDPATPIEETLRALDDLVRQGKVRYIGCSNFEGWRLTEALWCARLGGLESFISCQNEYSLLERGIEAELLPAMAQYGVGLLPYYPLAGGLLTGKYAGGAAPAGARLTRFPRLAGRHLSARNRAMADKLDAYARERGRSLLELSMSWLAMQPRVSSVIAGASTPEQVEANAKALGWTMSAQELAEIDAITRG